VNPHVHRQHPRRSVVLITLATLLLVVSSVAFRAWAAPGADPLRQSVPTKTPVIGKPLATKTLPPLPSPTPIPTPTLEPKITLEPGSGPPLIMIGSIVVTSLVLAILSFTMYRRQRRRAVA